MNDLKFALRQLLKNPGFTAVAVLTLALGIGAGTAIFSTLDGVLFRSLPYPEAERLVQLYETLPDGSLNSAAGGVFLDWREHHSDLESVALIHPVSRNLHGGDSPERLSGLEATHEFLDVLGIKPIVGRGFLPEEDQPGANNQVVILSEDTWRSRFGGSESVVGGTLRLDEVEHTIIGVLPSRALPRGVWGPAEAQFVVPSIAQRTPRGKFSRSEHWASVYGRLKPGVSVQQADAGLKALKLQLNPVYPGYKRDWSAAVHSLRERLSGGPRPVLLTLVGAVAVLLLIACANVANLLLARARNRSQEIAVRAALGASPRRIMRQVLTESLLLAALGGLSGMLLSVWGIQLLGRLTSEFLPGGMTPQLDLRVLGFSFVLSMLTGLLFGVLPAWQIRRPDLNEVLKSEGKNSTSGGRHRTQSILVVSEVALTVALLAAAGLLLRSLANTVNADPGFQPRRALAFELSLPKATYPNDAARFAFSQLAMDRIRSLPGVENVGTGMGVPFSGGEYGERVGRSDQPRSNSDPIARINYVSAGYLEALGTRLMAGRALNESDNRTNAERVIVVNEAVVRRYFAGDVPVDRKLSLLGQDWRIVGVIADVPVRRLDVPTELCLYVPNIYNTAHFSIVARTTLPPLNLVAGIRREIQRLDPGLPLANVRALDSAMSGSMDQRRIILGLIAAFAATALVLACIGLYGVMSYSVASRRRELSIRLALGANRRSLAGLVLRDAFLLTAVGCVFGMAGALGAGQLLASQLYRVNHHGPVVIAGTVCVVVLVALVASWLPVRRAATVDPMVALRND